MKKGRVNHFVIMLFLWEMGMFKKNGSVKPLEFLENKKNKEVHITCTSWSVSL